MAGFHTYLQSRGIALDSIDAIYFNQELFQKLWEDSLEASRWMAQRWGPAPWAVEAWEKIGPKDDPLADLVRNCSRLAVAPTKSTALIMGGISEGINPDPAFVYTQNTAGGEVARISPVLLEVMKSKNVYNKNTVQDILDKFGSVQHVDWLTEEEKKVFRTAFEYDQNVLIRLAAQRGQWIDQWQSLNLFFAAGEDPKYIADVHRAAFENENILALYYVYSRAGVQASKDRTECEVCS